MSSEPKLHPPGVTRRITRAARREAERAAGTLNEQETNNLESSNDRISRDNMKTPPAIDDSVTPPRSPQESSSNIQRETESPDANCSICLGKLENKSFTDSCLHTFCFTCLLEWAKVKAVCPLCKQPFKSIIHNVRSAQDYDQYELRPADTSSFENPEGRRFRYRTSMTRERWLERLHSWQNIGARQFTRNLNRSGRYQNIQWTRLRQPGTASFRLHVYTAGLRASEVSGRVTRTRNVSPEFFRSNPATLHRLVPWLNRELTILLRHHPQQIPFLLELILDLVKRYHIQSEEFREHINSFTHQYTEHFVHEFFMFASSPYNLSEYDRQVSYNDPPMAQMIESSSSSEDDIDDVVVVGGEAPVLPRYCPIHSTSSQVREPYSIPSRHGHDYMASASFRRRAAPVTPLLDRVRNFLSITGDNTDTARSGWESPELFPELSGIQSHDADTDPLRHSDLRRSQTRESASDDGEDIEIVGYEKPWNERSPIHLISSGDDTDSAPSSSKKKLQDGKHKPGRLPSAVSFPISRRPQLYVSRSRWSSSSPSPVTSRSRNKKKSKHHKKKKHDSKSRRDSSTSDSWHSSGRRKHRHKNKSNHNRGDSPMERVGHSDQLYERESDEDSRSRRSSRKRHLSRSSERFSGSSSHRDIDRYDRRDRHYDISKKKHKKLKKKHKKKSKRSRSDMDSHKEPVGNELQFNVNPDSETRHMPSNSSLGGMSPSESKRRDDDVLDVVGLSDNETSIMASPHKEPESKRTWKSKWNEDHIDVVGLSDNESSIMASTHKEPESKRTWKKHPTGHKNRKGNFAKSNTKGNVDESTSPGCNKAQLNANQHVEQQALVIAMDSPAGKIDPEKQKFVGNLKNEQYQESNFDFETFQREDFVKPQYETNKNSVNLQQPQNVGYLKIATPDDHPKGINSTNRGTEEQVEKDESKQLLSPQPSTSFEVNHRSEAVTPIPSDNSNRSNCSDPTIDRHHPKSFTDSDESDIDVGGSNDVVENQSGKETLTFKHNLGLVNKVNKPGLEDDDNSESRCDGSINPCTDKYSIGQPADDSNGTRGIEPTQVLSSSDTDIDVENDLCINDLKRKSPSESYLSPVKRPRVQREEGSFSSSNSDSSDIDVECDWAESTSQASVIDLENVSSHSADNPIAIEDSDNDDIIEVYGPCRNLNQSEVIDVETLDDVIDLVTIDDGNEVHIEVDSQDSGEDKHEEVNVSASNGFPPNEDVPSLTKYDSENVLTDIDSQDSGEDKHEEDNVSASNGSPPDRDTLSHMKYDSENVLTDIDSQVSGENNVSASNGSPPDRDISLKQYDSAAIQTEERPVNCCDSSAEDNKERVNCVMQKNPSPYVSPTRHLFINNSDTDTRSNDSVRNLSLEVYPSISSSPVDICDTPSRATTMEAESSVAHISNSNFCSGMPAKSRCDSETLEMPSNFCLSDIIYDKVEAAGNVDVESNNAICGDVNDTQQVRRIKRPSLVEELQHVPISSIYTGPVLTAKDRKNKLCDEKKNGLTINRKGLSTECDITPENKELMDSKFSQTIDLPNLQNLITDAVLKAAKNNPTSNQKPEISEKELFVEKDLFMEPENLQQDSDDIGNNSISNVALDSDYRSSTVNDSLGFDRVTDDLRDDKTNELINDEELIPGNDPINVPSLNPSYKPVADTELPEEMFHE